jgi:hypothetical protein
MIAILRELTPALAIIIAVVLAAWRLGRHFGALLSEVRGLAAGVDSLARAVEHLDRRLDALERGPTLIPRRNHGPRSENPRHPEAP